uniref:Adhesion G-protein coupled receptor V1 n=1 Tax=Callorhinchus milii TaxID=7868 RepID=A0A4W3JB69_CALMI
MPAVFLVAELVLGLCATLAFGNTEVKFAGQTEFVVNETSTSVIRLVIERTGNPANITALLLLRGDDTGDFEATSAAARILTTESNKTVYIAVRDDELPEADETFAFYLQLQVAPANVTLGAPSIATITILSNDNAFGIISFNVSSPITVDEPRGENQFVPITLIREKGTYGTVTVDFEITGLSSASKDISPTRGRVILPPGRAIIIYNLIILDDKIPENDEVFRVRLMSAEGGAEINSTQNTFQIKINKNDSPLRLSQAAYAVSEADGVITMSVIRGRDRDGNVIGSDNAWVSINYQILTGNSSACAVLMSDFIDLQPNRTIVFPPYVYEANLKFQIIDDLIPEIAETFQVVLLEETLQGDAVLQNPSAAYITIEPNDKPNGVLSISSALLTEYLIIDEDLTTRFDKIVIVRNGGTHAEVSVNWQISRNSSNSSAVTTDLVPASGILTFAEGQMLATVNLTVVSDDLPEAAETYLFQLLNHTVQGGAELDEPTQIVFYIQDSDDVYGLIEFHPFEEQRIESSPAGRFLSLSFARKNGTLGVVRLNYTVLYIPVGALDRSQAKDNVLNISSKNNAIFMSGQSEFSVHLPIRNDAFLQNGASFLVQLDTVELVNIFPLIPSVSPRLGDILNISLTITPDLANGEIGFTSNETLFVSEPENSSDNQVSIALQRDGTDGLAAVYWSLSPTGLNRGNVTSDDLGPFSGSVTFFSGQSSAAVNIVVKPDDLPETNETMIISLDRTNLDNQVLKSGFTSREIIILQNDDPGGIFEFSPQTRGPYLVQVSTGETVSNEDPVIVRYRGAFLKQFIRYSVEPSETFEFYGNTGILKFDPGEREIVITLLAREDGIPELEEYFSAKLSSHGSPPSKLGAATEVNITVLKNDDPHGLIQFSTPEFTRNLNESKAIFPVIRDQGSFGNVSVFWIIDPIFTEDVYPVQGMVSFNSAESSKNITLQSLPDEIPEDMETFTITLFNATGGARIGNAFNATLHINRNDDPIYFKEPITIRVQEGTVANFTVVRNGTTDFVATVVYYVENGGTSNSEGDFLPLSGNNTLMFDIGEETKTVSVVINDDDNPETDETFYIELLNSTGDTVVYGAIRATVIIEANDDPNGIFSLEPLEKSVQEGDSNNFMIVRQRGKFGNVSVSWHLFVNESFLKPGQEFIETCGTLLFTNGEQSLPITLHALADGIPEFNEIYTLRLLNVSGGSPGPGGELANTSLSVNVVIPFNDDPFGVFVLNTESQDREIAEDVLSVDDISYITNFTILRQKGTFGDVRVGWEILSSAFRYGLPQMVDFILVGTFPSDVELRPHARRHHTGTDVLYFSGAEDAYGTVSPEYHPRINYIFTNFTLSAWVIPNPYTDGFIIAKTKSNGTIFYALKMIINESHVSIVFYYTLFGSNVTHASMVTALKYIEENTWIHIIIIVDDGILDFYLDGILLPDGTKHLKAKVIADGPGVITVGADAEGQNRFTGLMQDLRMYVRKLSRAEIHEIHATPAKLDLQPISGYLEYRQGERKKSFIVAARDDSEEEGEEFFTLKLTMAYGGARILQDGAIARLRIQKSDGANGLFGFTGTCIPQTSAEGSTISCIVERTRGALDYVYVNYNIMQIDSDSGNVTDFANSSGTITFPPWQRSEVLNIHALDDDLPELAEHFIISLVSAISGDGKPGSTLMSGASIDPEKMRTEVIIKPSDHPYGLLQFSTGPLPERDQIIPPAHTIPRITVKEEAGQVRLLVVRAQGLLGIVLVGYQTVPLTAVSSSDYQSTAGILAFQPGERYKYITINITDDSNPEMPKTFKVELTNSDGEGSGSGDGELDLFLPAVHVRASLGIASEIIVTIDASDDAYGVFQFSNDSLHVNGTEPEGGHDIVLLQVVRAGGALSQVTLFWEVASDPYSDLLNTHGNITFEIGQTQESIMVQVASNNIPELDKEFTVYITNVSKGNLGVLTNATLIILANDDPYGVFIFSGRNRPVSIKEEEQNVTLTIQRLKGLWGITIVTYTTFDDTESADLPSHIARATKWSDYLAISGSVIFETNQTEANITIPILDDLEPEQRESVFVCLSNVILLKGMQNRLISESPRLGPKNEIIAQVIIDANDDAFGILQLSATAVQISENYIGPIINVTRTGGIFEDVSVKFQTFSMTARVGEDYSVASSDVILLEGETSKAVPIYLLNDITPEIDESFRIELINQTTGGAVLGELTQATVTIEASDDPYGSFVFQSTKFIVEEPEFNTAKVKLPIVRNGGTLGAATIQWVATMNGQLASSDLQLALGEVTFTPGQTIHTLQLELLADDFPEIEEVIHVQLTHTSSGSSIGTDKVADIIVPANDNPHGTVYFRQTIYRVQEPLEGNSVENISLRRSGGYFGQLRIFYATFETDVVALLVKEGQDIFSYYDPPILGIPNGQSTPQVNVSLERDPLHTCAAACLKERACFAFSFTNTTGRPKCLWMASTSNILVNGTEFTTYCKNTSSVSSLFSTQATPGSDYEPITGMSVTMRDGDQFANLSVSIQSDTIPERDEQFAISLLRVELLNEAATLRNQPAVGQPNVASVVIAMNGDAFGIFLIYSTNPNATDQGLYLEVTEQAQVTVQLVIERRRGNLGQVTVEWNVVGGTASRDIDFVGDVGILTFAEVITLTIVDDKEPEDSETILIALTRTEGGSRILPSSDTVTVVILANDNVGGVISFQTSSRSVIGREGENLLFLIERSPPGLGNVTVTWSIHGRYIQENFGDFNGTLLFSEGVLNASFLVRLVDDHIPEEKEEYRIILSNVRTQGISSTGAAVIDDQGYEAVLTVEASDEPHGVVNFAPSSRMVSGQEGNKTIQIFVSREFGSLGAINITYETVKGSLISLNLTEGSLAEPGLDFLPVSGFAILEEGETTIAINITILEVKMSPTYAEGLVSQVTIDANDGVKGVIQWQSIDFEVNETTNNLTLVMYRDRGTYGNVSLFLYPQNLEAQLGLDFSVTPMTVVFGDGERYKYIQITILDDDVPEGDEHFQMIIASPSFGLELGEKTTATVIIFASDDGHGILSFNNSEHFYLKEPTALGLSESVATLHIMRFPPQGTFGVVTVQYLITSLNGSDPSLDLTPTQGFIVLEEGIRMKTLQISAILDEEPEMDEQFTVTLFAPTGGARMGEIVQTLITVLQNQAPLGIFSIFPIVNRTHSVSLEEGNRTLYLKVSRSNGLESRVSVEWETKSGTAYGMSKFLKNLYDKVPLFFSQDFRIQDPTACTSFVISETSYVVIAHGQVKKERASNISVYMFTLKSGLTLVYYFIFEKGKPYKSNLMIFHHLIFLQVYRWNGNSFILHQSLPTNGAVSLTLFNRGSLLYMAVSQLSSNQTSVLYQWSDGEFRNPENLTVPLCVFNFIGNLDPCLVYIWETGQSFFKFLQSIPVHAVRSIDLFTPASGFVHLLLASENQSFLYSWNSAKSQFSLVLEAPGASQMLSVSAPSLNGTKTLIVSTGDLGSRVYELASVSNQSDFIPMFGELVFEPGDEEAVIAVNILDDDVPEETESFTVRLKNSKGGAEIGFNGQVMVHILPNDDAYGIIGFSQSSLSKQVEELDQDSMVTLSIERLRGTHSPVTVQWEASGSFSDIFPTSGVVVFGDGQALATISLMVLADNIPEATEVVTITLVNVTTVELQDQDRGGVLDWGKKNAILTILPNDSPYGVVGWHPDSLFTSVQEPGIDPVNVTLIILREHGFLGDIAVQYSTKSVLSMLPASQASENQDYTAKKATVIIQENATQASITVTILTDKIPELRENFLVNITEVELTGITLAGGGQPSVKRLGMEVAEIAIEENDDPRGIIQFNVTKDMNGAVVAYEVDPPRNLLKLPVIRNAGTFGAVNVAWEAKPGSASLSDFRPAYGNLTIDSGVVEIFIIDDNLTEFLETFSVILTKVTGGAKMGDDIVTTVNIPNNDSPVGVFGFEQRSVTIREPKTSADPAGLVSFTVRRDEGHGSVEIVWQVDDSAENDLIPLTGTLSFNETETRKTLVLRIYPDAVLEGEERYSIQLVSATNNADISPVYGIATIIILGDNAASGMISIATSAQHVLIGEPVGSYNGSATITIVRGPGIFGDATINWIITPAVLNEFAETEGTFVMRDRQSAATIWLQVLDDNIPEERQYYQLQLRGVSGGAVINDSSASSNITMVASDFPYGQFAFSRELLQISENAEQANLTVVRSHGSYGGVSLLYQTYDGTALSDADFTSKSGQLLFGPREQSKWILIDIIDDNTPEGPEDFFVKILEAELLGGRFHDFNVGVNGLQLDQPPMVGNISSTRIVIQSNDNAEGIIEFEPQFLNIQAEENIGIIGIPVIRRQGTYGVVTADFVSRAITAFPDGIDYILTNNTIQFQNGQNQSFINVSIIDDTEREYDEQFEIQLIAATGGAILGTHLSTKVTIRKSDSPDGLIRFLNQSQFIIPNPSVTQRLMLMLERTGGLNGDVEVKWSILGPNSAMVLPSSNADFGGFVNGSFNFGAGEAGIRTIELQVLPHGEIEVQETFIIKLSLGFGEAEIDAKAGNVSLMIQKFGDPNGIVQFVEEALYTRTYLEPSNQEKLLNITYLIKRTQGLMGDIKVHWELQSDSNMTGDFSSTSGIVIIPDMQRNAEIGIRLLADDVPELDEVYTISLIAVEGGATLNEERKSLKLNVPANDDPHGVFAVYSNWQTVIVQQDLSRHIQINITRHSGTFENVIVDYKLTSTFHGQGFFIDGFLGTVLARDGTYSAVALVPIINQAFLGLHFNFTVELTNVSLVAGNTSIPPRLNDGASSAIIFVPAEAANSEVGFDSLVLRVSNVSTGSCQAVISRKGVYGLILVEWRSGYPDGIVPGGVTPATVTPASGSVVLSHGEQSRPVLINVPTEYVGEESFALHLSAVYSNVTGKAKLRSGFTVAEIEPMGVFQFASNSRQVSVEEDAGTATLYVQRLFGFRGNKTKLTYYTTAGSAKPGEDYEHIQDGELIFETHQTEASIKLFIINDNISEMDQVFYLNLSGVEVLGLKPTNPDEKPRLNLDFNVSFITIVANDVFNGLLSIGPAVTQIVEDTDNSTAREVFLHIRRTMGFTGVINVSVTTFGRNKALGGLEGTPFQNNHESGSFSWAEEGADFDDEILHVTLQDGEREIAVSIQILDDNEPEGQELFYVYLTDPGGGAQIIGGKDENGFTAFAEIIISGSDLQNGIVGFNLISQNNLVLDEDSDNRKIHLQLQRQEDRTFEDVMISWRVTFDKTTVLLETNGVNLVNELTAISGKTTCASGQTECTITIEIKPDKIPEFETWFYVEIYDVGAGAMINNTARFLNITVLESDKPRGLIFFAIGSRLPVVQQKASLLSLQIVRESGTSTSVNVSYSMQELRKAELVGSTLISPAVAGMDFVKSEGIVTFQPGQSSIGLDIMLTPELASSNPLPKRFQVVLYSSTTETQLDEDYSTANITIVSDTESQFFWGLLDQLYQPLDDNILKRVLQNLQNKIVTETTREQLSGVVKVLEKAGEKSPFSDANRGLVYDILCALLDPGRKDTRGVSQLAEVTEKFAFSLLTDVQCGSPGQKDTTVLDTCQYLTIEAYHWYPQQINGHMFDGKNGDSLRLPERLLEISASSLETMSNGSCQRLQFTEYSSQQWFQTSIKGMALNDKIFSVGLKDRNSRPLADNNEITYQIHTLENRIIPHKSSCLLWNQAANSWLSDGQFCRVVEDTTNYVECACSHMSIYSASAQTDNLSSYNEAFYSAGFICISGFALAVLSYLFCSRFSMFAAKLLMHMMVACLGTQISFLVSVYLSRELSVESCSALGLVTHYLYLCQFSWMLIQSVNFWQVLVMNDEHTDRRYLLFFTLSWGLPAFVMVLLVIILRGAYHWTIHEIYGILRGDVCFIPNLYAALATAALMPLLCLVGVFVIFIYAYQMNEQWKSYDDIFRGRANGTEVPLVLYLFALISLTWLWGGLHMAYGHLWMLILFVIFNSFQGLYVFVVYFVLHNQLCWPVKASYTVEMNGHPAPGATYLTHGSGTPSVGGEISKSTQNLIAAMEEIPADWERTSLRPISQTSSIFKQGPQNASTYATAGAYDNSNLVTDEESQEFDDLIFALKTGAALNVSDNESCHGSQDGGSIANSQIVELRRIPIADTHL